MGSAGAGRGPDEHGRGGADALPLQEKAALAILSQVSGRSRALVELEQIKAAIAAETGSQAELLEPGFRRAPGIAVALAMTFLSLVTAISATGAFGSTAPCASSPS